MLKQLLVITAMALLSACGNNVDESPDSGIDLLPADSAPETSEANQPWTCSSNEECDDGHHCTIDSCGRGTTCNYVIEDGFCLIAGVCYPVGTRKQGTGSESCRACLPYYSQTEWSIASWNSHGFECNDGHSCTYDDRCDWNGECWGILMAECEEDPIK